MSVTVCVLTIALLTSLQVQVLAQAFPYGVPVSYDNEDDDLGMLLAIMLLAGRNRGCNCCNCCNGGQNIPIPYPIPFPTNNPIINKGSQKSDDDDSEDKPKVKISKGGGGNTIDVEVTEKIINN